jgi:phenylpropionate dioxygenase-like ring-hydroxylating dioxygenase large terminal subunit
MEVEILNISPLIQPEHYHSPLVFEKEQNHIFENQWVFAGFLFDLQNENDFITTQVGGKSVVVQYIKGELKAFLNVCSHRFSKIQCEAKGNRALVCPYHGWAYDGKGLPLGIPRKPNFGTLTKEKLQKLALEAYHLETCGQLVFVKKQTEQHLSLSEFLGHGYNTLLQTSQAFGKLIDCNEMVVNANWKIVVENTLEAYHINQVHTTTFKPIFGEQKEFNKDNIHTSIQVDLHTDFQKIEGMYQSRPYKLDGYFHLYIFPNLTLASSYGSSFSLQHFVPLNANQTSFVSYVFQTKLDDGQLSRKEQIMLNAMNDSIVNFNRTVFEEDKYICEKVQEGVVMTSKLGILSTEEERVLEFHKAYQKLMTDE